MDAERLSDEEFHFQPPIDVADLLAAAEEPEWAIASLAMVGRMLRAVARGGAVHPEWFAALAALRLAELDHDRDPCVIFPARYVACRLTAAGLLAAHDTGAVL